MEVSGLTGLESGGEIHRCLTWKEVAVSVGISRWGEGVFPMLKHGTGVGGGELTQLGVKIKEDGVGLPVAKGMDGCLVDAGDKQGGGTPRMEAVGFDVFGGDVGDVVDSGGGPAEFSGDVPGGDVVGAAGRVIVAVEGSVG